jgi:hypothetical protein
MRRVLLVSLAALAVTACGKDEKAAAPPAADAAAVVPAAGLTLGADNLPRFKAGLWEVVKTEDGQTETSRHCVGEEANAEVREMLTRETPQCQTTRSATPAGIKVNATCDQGGLKTETALSMTGSPSAYDLKLGIYVVTPDGKREGGEVAMKARHVGACPAGVKPGEDVE